MEPRKLNVMFATFPYGGNGNSASEHPDIRNWLLQTVPRANRDERVGLVTVVDFADTPVTMTRNAAVCAARKEKMDVLVMVDSDQKPDMYLRKNEEAEPFWDVCFNFLYKHWKKGPVVIGAPYVGGGDFENIFVFKWGVFESDTHDEDHKLMQYGREEAVNMGGIQPCAALPTGLVMFDVRAFELTEPKEPGDKPWFYYEYTNLYEQEKASTEDVTATRDISIKGCIELGYNPVYCAWSSWAGHWKPKCRGMPRLVAPEHIAAIMSRGVDRLPGKHQKNRIESGIDAQIDWSKAPRFSTDAKLPRGEDHQPAASSTNFVAASSSGDCEHVVGMNMCDADAEAIRQVIICQGLDVCRPLVIYEIGCWQGYTSMRMFEALSPTHAGKIYCVDHFKGSRTDKSGTVVEYFGGPEEIKKGFMETVGDKFGSFIHLLEGESTEVAKRTDLEPADLVFIDAEHTYEALKADVRAWLPHLKPDGVLFGHDYGDPAFPGVSAFVQEFFGSKAMLEGAKTWEGVDPVAQQVEESSVWVVYVKDITDEHYRKLGLDPSTRRSAAPA